MVLPLNASKPRDKRVCCGLGLLWPPFDFVFFLLLFLLLLLLPLLLLLLSLFFST